MTQLKHKDQNHHFYYVQSIRFITSISTEQFHKNCSVYFPTKCVKKRQFTQSMIFKKLCLYPQFSMFLFCRNETIQHYCKIILLNRELENNVPLHDMLLCSFPMILLPAQGIKMYHLDDMNNRTSTFF